MVDGGPDDGEVAINEDCDAGEQLRDEQGEPPCTPG